jgi:UDP-glucose 4-epimerase
VVSAFVSGHLTGMRVVVTGATGNVGTSVLRAMSADAGIDDVVALARRDPGRELDGAEFMRADVTADDLVRVFDGADAVVHLAWLIQPGRDEATTQRVNVFGSRRVFEAVVAAKVPALIYASSVGAYSPGPKDRRVDESWPTTGIATSFYSRHKAEVERELDRLQEAQPHLRVVRLRPGLIFKRQAATEIRRLFVGPLLPRALLRSSLVPMCPDVAGLRFQAVHSDDVGEAYRAAVLSDCAGAFNVAAEPVIGPEELAGMLGAPLMSTERARRELAWTPRHTAIEAISELAAGMRDGADDRTAPLARSTSGPFRIREFLTGIGARQ